MPYKDPEKRREYNRERARRLYAEDPEKFRARSRSRQARLRAETPDEVRESKRAWRAANPGKVRDQKNAWRAANEDHVREQQRAWHAAHPGRDAEQHRSRRAVNPEPFRAADRFRRHGIRPDEFARMWQAQGGKCCYCGDDLPRETKQVHVDHDHSCCPPNKSCTYCRRGIACGKCNAAVGYGLDDPDRLERIAANLRRLKADVRERLANATVQDELPLNVALLHREAG